jgi:hypothetical protein
LLKRASDFFLPFRTNILASPLYLKEAPRTGYGLTARALRRYSLKWVFIMAAITLSVWIIGSLLSRPVDDKFRPSGTVATFDLFLLIMIVSIVAGGLLDFRAVQAALNSIDSEANPAWWDLLRLTMLREDGIMRAKHASAQMRVWRLTMMIVGLRVGSVLTLALHILGMWAFQGENPFYEWMPYSLSERPLEFVVMASLLILIFALTATAYVIEPLWRLRALSALGLSISAFTRGGVFAVLIGLMAVFAVWITQLMVLAALLIGSSFVMLPLSMAATSVTSSGRVVYPLGLLPVAIIMLVYTLIAAVSVYGFYQLIQTWSLRRVIHRVFRDAI